MELYGSPVAYYDQQNTSNVKRTPFRNPNVRAVDPDWEPYDENLMPSKKSKVHVYIHNE